MKEINIIIEKSGFKAIEINNKFASAKIYFHGAHITHFQPHGEEELLFLSKDVIFQGTTPLRGGIPICWPWFGSHPTDNTKPFHGFARNQEWELVNTENNAEEETIVEFQLTENELSINLFPYKFALIAKFTIGKALTVELITKNRDNKPFTIGGALHTYFQIEDINKISIMGLDNVKYLDATDDWKIKTQKGDITFHKLVDSVYIDTTETCIIKDLNRNIEVNKKGSSSTVIWNPWIEKSKGMKDFQNNEYLKMVCVETTNALNDIYEIKPNKTHSLSAKFNAKGLL